MTGRAARSTSSRLTKSDMVNPTPPSSAQSTSTPFAPSRPLPCAPVPRPSRPQPRTPQPRWSRRHSSVGGEAVKAWLIRRDVAYEESVPSVVIAKTTLTIAQALFLLIGVALGA